MRWLQWSTIDLEKGLGGVEVHARSLARELLAIGVDARFSCDPQDLERHEWDVIHTHGSAVRPFQKVPGPLRVHTLHGTTLGRMAACQEWLWIGGYAAEAREIEGVRQAQVVLSVHPCLSLLKLARALGKVTATCWNGWDSAIDGKCSPERPEFNLLLERLKAGPPFWVFLGRGADTMKGADLLRPILSRISGITFVAAPGDGFEDCRGVIRTGRLSSDEVHALLAKSAGLLVPSRYEGNALVVLEALSEGVAVVATGVGGVPVLPQGVQGLHLCASITRDGILERWRMAIGEAVTEKEREFRKAANRALLPTWRNVAEIALGAVEEARRK